MSHNPAAELAGTIQSASIKRNPDPKFDANPSTAASHKTPVRFRRDDGGSSTSPHPHPHPHPHEEEDVAPDEIPVSVLEAPPRTQTLPPLPDLRFEQSYLAKIKPYADKGQYFRVAWVTFLDHVIMPFSQGVVWNLLLHGWRVWNTAARFQGQGVGAKVRRWWWRTNNWKLPAEHA